MFTRRKFLKTAAAGAFGLSLPIQALASRKQKSGYFGLHPFIEAGITKQDIRDIARELGLLVWQKPSAACLASRIPYGDAITAGKLQRIEEAEAFLAGLCIGQLRVRLHGNLARIEVHKEDTGKILEQQSAVVRHFKSLGFVYITLDLEGYRSGSMDEVL